MKDYLNVSEIGSLFGLGIQTIHYYDKIGILKPAFREGKAGIRKYKFDQIYQLASIRYMRKLGYSIEEVRKFQDSRNPELTIHLLRERSKALQAQWRELMQIDDAILRKINYIESEMKHMDLDSIEIREFPERYYIPIGTEEELYIEDSFYFYPTIAFYEEDLKYFGALVEKASEPVTSIIPAGRYLVGYHKGAYETIQQSMQRMRDAYPDYEFEPLITCFNIIDQFVEQDNENYVTQIQMLYKTV